MSTTRYQGRLTRSQNSRTLVPVKKPISTVILSPFDNKPTVKSATKPNVNTNAKNLASSSQPLSTVKSHTPPHLSAPRKSWSSAVSSIPVRASSPSSTRLSLSRASPLGPDSQPKALASETSTPKNQNSDEAQLLKKLNNELMKRLMAVEFELQAAKDKLDAISKRREDPDNLVQPCSISADSVPSSNSQVQNVTVPDSRRPRLLICGDSMTRDMATILQQLLPHYSVESVTYPGAPLSQCIKDISKYSVNFSKSDIILILAGSNDIPLLTLERLETLFQSICELGKSTNLIFSGIPYRYDNIKFNSNIFASNLCILKLCQTYNFFYFESNFFMSRDHYTRHGLHFNLSGKQHFCEFFSKSIEFFQPPNNVFIMPNLKRVPETLYDVTCESLLDVSSSNSDSSLNSTFFRDL